MRSINMTGVLLAPRGEFHFSGQLGDLENQAESVGTNRVFIVVSSGCCSGFGYVGGQAGTLVVEPPTTASTQRAVRRW